MPSHKILIADDNRTSLMVVYHIIQGMGDNFDIIHAEDGRRACELALHEQPDLILMDWRMPVMVGIDAVRFLKLHKETAEIPVIMTTAMTDTVNLNEALEAGAIDYLRKPLDSLEVTARVKAALRLHDYYKEIRRQKEEISRKNNELALVNQELIQMNRLRDRLLSIISHDLKTPFNSLKSVLDVFSQYRASFSAGELEDYIERIKGSLNSVSVLLENVLRWSLTQMEREEFSPIKLNVTEVLERNVLIFEPSAHQKEISIMPNLRLIQPCYADINMVDLVVRNLVSNAIKFTRNGGTVTIDLYMKGEFIVVAVSDDGVGISPSIQMQLFGGDKIITTPGTSNERGSGLGLFLCKQYIEKNGGKIYVSSELGRGSKFWFTLPVWKESDEQTND